MYWECHITLKDKQSAKNCVEKVIGWKHSQIDGDPQLGDGVKQYATKNFKPTMSVEEVLHELQGSARCLRNWGFPVLREKIELVMYDTKGKKK